MNFVGLESTLDSSNGVGVSMKSRVRRAPTLGRMAMLFPGLPASVLFGGVHSSRKLGTRRQDDGHRL